MRTTSSFFLLRILPVFSLAAACAACSADSADGSAPSANGGAPPSSAAGAPDAERTIAEADIIQLDDERSRLYAMSRSGTLSVVDVSVAGRLSLLGQIVISGEPFEMVRHGDVLLAMSNGALRADGVIEPPTSPGAPAPPRDLSAGAIVAAIDIRDPANMRTLEAFKVAGEIADSRLVGDVLYLATYESGTCWSCSAGPRTLVTSFDVSIPSSLAPIDQAAFATEQYGTFNLAWSTPWKRSIVVTSERLYVGGLAGGATDREGIIEVLDIRDPGGKLGRGASIRTAGPILSRWQADEHEGVLRVVSQRGAGRTANGLAYPEIETFRIESASSFVPLGHVTMRLPRMEGLKTVRFDAERAYAITFNQTDPLFVLDLSVPTSPQQKGELFMPGWVFHLEPRGDRLIGLGLDRNDTRGNLNVSLFDVSDMWAPRLLARTPFGPTNMYEDYQITQSVLPEDQDRIQKAFSISSDGLIAVPFSNGRGCTSTTTTSGVQLLQWTGDTLALRALLPVSGNPRRALRREGELIAVSDSTVSSFSLTRTDVARPTANLVIGTCTDDSTGRRSGAAPYAAPGGYPYSYGAVHESDGGYAHCAVSEVGTNARPPFWCVLVGLAALFARGGRRAKRRQS